MQELYLKDSYMKEFDAKVTSVKDGKFITLDQSAFYPKGGGQPFDTGKLIRKSDNKEFNLIFGGKFDGITSYQIEPENELNQGDEVKGILDWDRRYKLMRMHTAAHVLSAIFHKEGGALITGNQLDIEKTRIDFSAQEFDRDKFASYIEIANKTIKEDKQVKVYELPREEAEKIPAVFKLAKALPESIKNIRIVEIKDIDKQADGGTHVNSLKEIGKITLLKCENKGKSNRRLYFTLD